MTNTQLEICCGDIDSVAAAIQGGANRIELCSALELGGLTPSWGLIATARNLIDEREADVKLHVLIRPRPGDFIYNENEIVVMERDIQEAIRQGADAVVIGALQPDGNIDIESTRRMMKAAKDTKVTFHRAIDQCIDMEKALEEIIALGCDYILTSGGQATAPEGIPQLKKLNEKATGRITLIAASGVSQDNAAEILKSTGLTNIHASARSAIQPVAEATVKMGTADSNARMVTDPQKVKSIISIINKK